MQTKLISRWTKTTHEGVLYFKNIVRVGEERETFRIETSGFRLERITFSMDRTRIAGEHKHCTNMVYKNSRYAHIIWNERITDELGVYYPGVCCVTNGSC